MTVPLNVSTINSDALDLKIYKSDNTLSDIEYKWSTTSFEGVTLII